MNNYRLKVKWFEVMNFGVLITRVQSVDHVCPTSRV